MLKDITLGQYFPGETIVHKLDPRTKILIVIAYIVITFCVSSILGYIALAAFIILSIALSKIPVSYVLKGIKPIIAFIIITALFNLFLTSGEIIWQWGFLKITYEGIRFAIFMVLRLTFLILGTTLMTLTTSPIALTDGMEALLKPFTKIGLPAHELAMMMSIALRFIPTLMEETEKIMKAQAARGADIENGSILKRAKAMVPILIPLFVSAFRRADELATAMECRCYGVTEKRTSLHELKFRKRDSGAAISILILAGIIVAINIFFKI